MKSDMMVKMGQELASLRLRVAELESLEAERTKVTLAEEHSACFDNLTGLPNRSIFYTHLSRELAVAARKKRIVAVLFFGLDRFKLINDCLGPAAGDTLLKEVAVRLQSCLRKSDLLARPGRDEFMIMLPETHSEADVQWAAERIIAAFATPVTLEGREFIITCSLGGSLYPDDGESPQELIRRSYTALNRARQEGKNYFHFYSSTINAGAFDRLMMENSLRLALKRKNFHLHYQPQVNLATGRIDGVEALLRWHHPDLGQIPPSIFIPVAEEIGIMADLGDWVLQTACLQNKAYQEAGFPPMRMAVNLSPQQLYQPAFTESVARILDETGLDPEFLDLEMTEGALIKDVEVAVSTLNELNRMGIRLTIDDFGTGYSSLSYLRFFPINKLKIDKSFIECLDTDQNNAAISQAIITLAHSLKLHVTAEGVETVDQLNLLHSMHCDEAQGYLLGHPLCSEGTALLLAGLPTPGKGNGPFLPPLFAGAGKLHNSPLEPLC